MEVSRLNVFASTAAEHSESTNEAYIYFVFYLKDGGVCTCRGHKQVLCREDLAVAGRSLVLLHSFLQRVDLQHTHRPSNECLQQVPRKQHQRRQDGDCGQASKANSRHSLWTICFNLMHLYRYGVNAFDLDSGIASWSSNFINTCTFISPCIPQNILMI